MKIGTAFVLIALVLALVAVSAEQGCEPEPIKECSQNSDCVAAQCCHPTSCVPLEKEPWCKGVACTLECRQGTMDCGQGHCECIDNKCEAVMNK